MTTMTTFASRSSDSHNGNPRDRLSQNRISLSCEREEERERETANACEKRYRDVLFSSLPLSFFPSRTSTTMTDERGTHAGQVRNPEVLSQNAGRLLIGDNARQGCHAIVVAAALACSNIRLYIVIFFFSPPEGEGASGTLRGPREFPSLVSPFLSSGKSKKLVCRKDRQTEREGEGRETPS